MGLGDSVVAVTHECDYPAAAGSLPVITSSVLDHTGNSSLDIHSHITRSVHDGSSIYHLDDDLLKRLDPDIIVTQELCDVCAVSYQDVQNAIKVLDGDHRVISLEPTCLSTILETIERLGGLTGTSKIASTITQGLQQRIAYITTKGKQASQKPRVLAMEWLEPVFAGGHWIPEMIRIAGGYDGLGRETTPSMVVSPEAILAYNPEVIVLMPCGFNIVSTISHFLEARLPTEWASITAVQNNQIYAVDGSAYFNRPGPRIVDGLEILAEILHPELFPRTKPDTAWQRVS